MSTKSMSQVFTPDTIFSNCATDDFYSISPNSKPILLDVMENDRGKFKYLYSIDNAKRGNRDQNPINDLLVPDKRGRAEKSDLGATIRIKNGKIEYDASTISFEKIPFFKYLDNGQSVLDTFGYAIVSDYLKFGIATVNVAVSGSRDLGFEDGGLTSGSWMATGQVDIITGDVTGSNPDPFADPGGAPVMPTEGTYLARLLAGQTPEDEVESFLGVNNDTIDSLNSVATDAAAIKTSLYLKKGDTVSFDWYFDERDGQSGTFNDTAFFTTLDGTLTKLADSPAVNTDGTGWQTWSFVVGSDLGLVEFGIGIANGLDGNLDSALYIDNLRVVSA